MNHRSIVTFELLCSPVNDMLLSFSSALLTAVPGLRAFGEQAAAGALWSSAAERSRLAPGSFLSLCQTHLQDASELQQQHSKELR